MASVTKLGPAVDDLLYDPPPPPVYRRVAGVSFIVFKRCIAVVLLLVLWQLLPTFGLVDKVFLPPFTTVVREWWTLTANGTLETDITASMVRAGMGFGLSLIIGVPLGFFVAWYRPVNEFLNPLLELFRNTASLALLPVFILTLGIGQSSKVAIILYSCLWPILLNTISGVQTVDPLLVKSARSMGLSSFRLFQKVVLPSAVPSIFTGIRQAGTHAILVLIAAELVGANSGLGFLVTYSEQGFQIPAMYAAIITISAIGIIVNYVLVLIERHFSTWRISASGS